MLRLEYLLHVMSLVALYAGLSTACDLVVGQLGCASLAQAAFFGLGAYATALASTACHLPPPAGVGIGIGLAMLLALLLAQTADRVREDYFVLASMAALVTIQGIFSNWTALTMGPLGVAGIPPLLAPSNPTLQGVTWALTMSAYCAIAILTMRVIRVSRFGRTLRVIRDDEGFSQTLGKNPAYFKLVAFLVSAALTAAGGSLFAHYMTFVDPTSFGVNQSLLILTMALLGGTKSLWGPATGAILLMTLPELLRAVAIHGSAIANLRQIILGAVMIAIVMFKPRGIVSGHVSRRPLL